MNTPTGIATLAPGAWLEHDGSHWRVIALEGTAVLLQDRRVRERQVLVEYLLSDTTTRPVVEPEPAGSESVVSVLDVAPSELVELDARVGHVREVLTGFKSGHVETAAPDEPRPPCATCSPPTKGPDVFRAGPFQRAYRTATIGRARGAGVAVWATDVTIEGRPLPMSSSHADLVVSTRSDVLPEAYAAADKHERRRLRGLLRPEFDIALALFGRPLPFGGSQ